MMLPEAHALMLRGLEESLFTGAVLHVTHLHETVFQQTYGTLGGPGTLPITAHSLFDLASLTKVLATVPCWLLMAAEDPRILDRSIRTRLSECPSDKAKITPRHLLAHASGFPAWRPYYLMSLPGDPRSVVQGKILKEQLEYPPGKGCIYSDLGFMVLARFVEVVSGYSFELFCREHIYSPLELASELMFHPLGDEHRTVLTRHGDSPGVVNDLNARALGGAAGHAGLFGSIIGVSALASAILDSRKSTAGFFDRDWTLRFSSRANFVAGCTRALGFDTPSAEGSSSGRYFPPAAFGHTGFTGTSLWIDPHRDLIVIVLTNRVIMGEADQRIKAFRPAVHDAVVSALFPRG